MRAAVVNRASVQEAVLTAQARGEGQMNGARGVKSCEDYLSSCSVCEICWTPVGGLANSLRAATPSRAGTLKGTQTLGVTSGVRELLRFHLLRPLHLKRLINKGLRAVRRRYLGLEAGDSVAGPPDSLFTSRNCVWQVFSCVNE
ncbi:hypothetical protein MHYP_G00168690 [Metynnis hypsauchen]